MFTVGLQHLAQGAGQAGELLAPMRLHLREGSQDVLGGPPRAPAPPGRGVRRQADWGGGRHPPRSAAPLSRGRRGEKRGPEKSVEWRARAGQGDP